jgi:pimeloyl-ACP methyl ester carboxylesterase
MTSRRRSGSITPSCTGTRWVASSAPCSLVWSPIASNASFSRPRRSPGLPDPPPFPAAWRIGLDVARPVADILVGVGLRLKADAWRRMVEERDSARLGPEVARMSLELLSLAAEEVGRLLLRWRVEGAVDAGIAVLRALTVDGARARQAQAAITAPTLMLWGADDRVIPRRLIREVEVAHPGWSSRTIDGVGHLLPWESPGMYVELAR